MKKLTFLVAIVLLAAFSFYSNQNPNTDPEVAQAETRVSDQATASILSATTTQEPESDASYSINTEVSTLEWQAGKIVGEPYTGNVSISSGEILEKDGNFVGGSFSIDMDSITHHEDKQVVVDHLKSEDFFNVAQYPSSTFVISNIEGTTGTVQVTGNLTIKDKTNEISFPATISQDEEKIAATAEFSIDRLQWDITYNSGSIFQQLGDKAIKDEIIFRLDLELTK